MKDKKGKHRTTIHDADIPMEKHDTLDLSEVPDEELFVSDDDIIGLSEDSPISMRHTDETLDDAEENILIEEEDYDVNAETIIAPSETETSEHDAGREDGEHGALNIGDVFDTDSQAVVASEDSDETISGLEEDISDFVEDESDSSERIIVSEPITIEKPAPSYIPEPKKQEPDDEVLELGIEAIVESADDREEEDETIELLVLAEEISDKDSQDIRDIDDIIGLGAEILENTRELIVPVGFHPDAEEISLIDDKDDILQTEAETKPFDEDDNFMSEVRQILAAQEAAELKTGIAPENVRETSFPEDIPESDDNAQPLSEEDSDDESVYHTGDIISPEQELLSAEADEILGSDSNPIIAPSDVEDFPDEDDESPKDDNNSPDIDVELAEKVFEKAEDEDDISDLNAETIIAPPEYQAKRAEPILEAEEDSRLSDIDVDLELAEKVFEKAEDEDDISDLNAATIIAPPEYQAKRAEPILEAEEDSNLSDIDVDLELAEKVFEKADDEDDISDLNAETIIALPEQSAESLRKDKDNGNLLDIDVVDLELDEEVSAKAEDEDDISDLNAETIIAPPEHQIKHAEPIHQDKDDGNLLDIDVDMELDEEVSEKAEDDDISDLNAETIIAPPEYQVKRAEPIHQDKDDGNLLDIDIDSDIVETAENEVISELNAETIIALAEDIPSPHPPEKNVLDISEDDIFELAPETIISSAHSDSTTDISSSNQDSTTDISACQPNTVIGKMLETESIADRELETVILPRENKAIEIRDKINLLKNSVQKKKVAKEISEELERLPVRKENLVESVQKLSEESPSDIDILDGEELRDDEKDLLKFLEMDLVPLDIPPETEKKKEPDNKDLEEDEYVPIEQIIKNPHEGEGTVIEDMFRQIEPYEAKGESPFYISITPEQMEAALERVIQKVFSEKIEHIVTQVIEKTFTEELEKKLRIILMQNDDERR